MIHTLTVLAVAVALWLGGEPGATTSPAPPVVTDTGLRPVR